VAGNSEARIRAQRYSKHHDAAPRRLRVTLRNGDASTRIGLGSTEEGGRVVGPVTAVTGHYRKVGYTQELRSIDAKRREFRQIFPVTVLSNEARQILT
jgi:hypothetical protein